jgi:hypothetical protein
LLQWHKVLRSSTYQRSKQHWVCKVEFVWFKSRVRCVLCFNRTSYREWTWNQYGRRSYQGGKRWQRNWLCRALNGSHSTFCLHVRYIRWSNRNWLWVLEHKEGKVRWVRRETEARRWVIIVFIESLFNKYL